MAQTNFAAIADVVDSLAVNRRRGADAFLRPVLNSAGGQFVVNGLPEEFAVDFLEAHDDPFVALTIRDRAALVVGADEDLAVADDRTAIGLGAELLDPQDVVSFRCPTRWEHFYPWC